MAPSVNAVVSVKRVEKFIGGQSASTKKLLIAILVAIRLGLQLCLPAEKLEKIEKRYNLLDQR